MSEATGLKLAAEDEDDLKVLSAALQNAVLKIGDIRFEPKARRLTVAANRFRWEAGRKKERIRSGLQLGDVLSVQSRKLKQGAPDAVLELLAVTFEAGEAPGGVVVFNFAGGGDLRVQVECLNAVLADLSQPWPTRRAPVNDG